ncbi:MAG: hypothetical protein FJX76_10425 [Armatimonadetes bacterium]|nr:hypothetical protein [Armatimonadota bacterium]
MPSQPLQCAIVLACEDLEAFRPLSYSVPPPLLPVTGVPALERVLGGLVAAGSRRIVVIAEHRFAALQQWLEEAAARQKHWPEISLAHIDQFAAAPERLKEVGSGRDRLLICGWNALWLEDGWRTLETPPPAWQIRAYTLPRHGQEKPATTAILCDVATLGETIRYFPEPTESEPPHDWLQEVRRAAAARGLKHTEQNMEGPPLLDGVGAWQRMNAGWPGGSVFVVSDSARIPRQVSLGGPGVIGARCRIEGATSIDASILMGDNRVGGHSRLHGIVLGPGDPIPPYARLSNACLHRGEIQPLEPIPGPRKRPKRGRRLLQELGSRQVRKRPLPADNGASAPDIRDVAQYARRMLGVLDESGERAKLQAGFLASGFQNKVCLVWPTPDETQEALPQSPEARRAVRQGRAAIVKWAVKGDPQPLWVEHHAMWQVQGRDITARSHWLDLRQDPFPYPTLVIEALPGRELRGADLKPSVLRRMGELLRRLHHQDGDALWEALPTFPSYGFGDLGDYMTDTVDMFRYYARYREDVGLADDALMGSLYNCVERLLKFVEESLALWDSWGSSSWPLRLCHGDLVPHNFLFDEETDRLWLIDWERAGVGDPGYELAWFLALNGLSGENETAFLEGYLGEDPRGLTDVDLTKVAPSSTPALLSRIQAYRKVTAMSWPIQILAYQARYHKERFPVTMEPREYVSFNLREAFKRLVDGFTYLEQPLGGWSASYDELEGMGKLLVMP